MEANQAVLDSAMSMRVYPGTGHPQRKDLLQVVEEMSALANLPNPRVYVVFDPDPNAFATGAELTRNPAGLAAALKKIEMDVAPTKAIKRGTAHLCIADPLGRKIDLRQSFWGDLLATHPPMHFRISKLNQMAYQATGAMPGAS